MVQTKAANAYLSRGVSPTKDDVHRAICGEPEGLLPGAFCKLTADPAGDPAYCAAMHADGAGTKSALAYLYYKETGDVSVFRGVAQDAVVMNLDDLACVGAVDGFLFSNTIGRNAHRVDGGVLRQIIDGYREFAETLAGYGIRLTLCGGETADVGDLVGTIIVDSTVFVRFPLARAVNCANIRPGDVIVGLASDGRAVYEREPNSGIGSNGLTAARHILLNRAYADKYPETFSPTIEAGQVYCGPYAVTDPLPQTKGQTSPPTTVGRALLSPTRTYLPILKAALDDHFPRIHGIIHCTGGGQVKCKGFGRGLHYIKDALFAPPAIFAAIRSAGGLPADELYQIFNMGHRMEVYCDPAAAGDIIAIAGQFGVAAKVVGRVERNMDEISAVTDNGNKVTIAHAGGEVTFDF
ncbi:MAG: hypothetical protein LBU58_04380 [Clostridiales bacterium]|jgi:phosphoribosylformylglycinamidine cyclo-ligase|nr:hypothetical protein [Clostridiales bacterium]